MPRLIVENPSDGGFFYWLAKYYLLGFIVLAELAFVSLLFLLMWIGSDVPSLDRFRQYRQDVPLTTAIRSWDGQLLGELARERRRLAEIDEMPPLLIQAFLAAEDRRFHQHRGLDLRGISRAAWANFRAGTVLQGGSTITQQLAKSFLGPERTLARKLREAVLALRLEVGFSKKEILFFYLNTIFLGHGAYGVVAAAERYFGKNLDQLTIDEMALLAGLARAPSRYSPIAHPQRARERRDLVLDLMHEGNSLRTEERTAAKSRPLTISPARDRYHELAPSFAEHVRRTTIRTLGEKALYEGGLTVETTVDLHLQALAEENIDVALRKLDKRQGWRGPVARLGDAASRRGFLERAAAEYPNGPADRSRPYLALVEEVGPRLAALRIGKARAVLGYAGLSWAAPYDAKDPTNDLVAGSIPSVLTPGDVVWVRPAGRGVPPEVHLEQSPRIEGAILTFDHDSGYELSHVGGRDFDVSSFDRVVQACRQPGSTFKPIYYSLALDSAFAMNSVLQDKPYVPEEGEDWKPRNIHGTLDGRVTLWASLVRSLNLPSIQLLLRVGAKPTADWARTLGISTPIHADKALALGASCTRLNELAGAFAVFARAGVPVEVSPIRRILDRKGRVLEDHSHPDDPWLDGAARLDRMAAHLGRTREPVISPRTAYLTSRVLRDTVLYGIAARAGTIGAPAAGKGGTSSDTMDVSFIGYTSRWLTAAWVGDDRYERPLGAEDASYTIAIPMWARYMTSAIGTRPHKEIPWQPRPAGLMWATIDPGNGQVVESDRPVEGGTAVRMVIPADGSSLVREIREN